MTFGLSPTAPRRSHSRVSRLRLLAVSRYLLYGGHFAENTPPGCFQLVYPTSYARRSHSPMPLKHNSTPQIKSKRHQMGVSCFFVSRRRKRYQPKILMIQGISVLFDAFSETFAGFSPKQRDFSVNQKRYPTFLGVICSTCASENSVVWWSENGDTRRVISRRRFSKRQASTGEALFSA